MKNNLLLILSLLSFLVSCNDDDLNCDSKFRNPFCNMFIRNEIEFKCLRNNGFELIDGKDELREYIYYSDSLKIILDIKLGDASQNDDEFGKHNVEIYGVTYFIESLPTLDSLNVSERLLSYDAEMVSRFTPTDDRYFYFFVKHRYNNIIYQCYGDLRSGLIELSLFAPVLDEDEVRRRKKIYQSMDLE